MDFEAALRLELITIPSLINKVFPLVAPTGTVAPYIVYASSDGLRERSMDGYLGLKQVDADLNVVASTYSDLKTLESAVIVKLISFQSRIIGTDGPFIQEITYEEPVELYEPLPKLHRAIINFSVYFE